MNTIRELLKADKEWKKKHKNPRETKRFKKFVKDFQLNKVMKIPKSEQDFHG